MSIAKIDNLLMMEWRTALSVRFSRPVSRIANDGLAPIVSLHTSRYSLMVRICLCMQSAACWTTDCV